MRLWHYEMLSALPHQQLVSQWRECCCIAANLMKHGSPRHMLVNKVLNYSSTHFIAYCDLVVSNMKYRGYNISDEVYNTLKYNIEIADNDNVFEYNNPDQLFDKWHNDRYFLQCICNLWEKYDCGGISDEEWLPLKRLIAIKFGEEIKLEDLYK